MLRRYLPALLAVAVVTIATGNQVFAQPVPTPVSITIDELGHGTYFTTGTGFLNLPAGLQADPGPGGLPLALTYGLLNPPSLVAGDIVLLEPGSGVSDLIRFNPAGTGGNPNYAASVLFYSDTTDRNDAISDLGFPTQFYVGAGTPVTIPEVGTEFLNGAVYTPLPGQPGYVAGFAVTYTFLSDVPEPGPLMLGGLATVIGLAFARFRSRWRRVAA